MQVRPHFLFKALNTVAMPLRSSLNDNSGPPQFTGRAVAALAADPDVMRKSGRVLVAASLAEEYGFTDVDGRRPRALTLEDV